MGFQRPTHPQIVSPSRRNSVQPLAGMGAGYCRQAAKNLLPAERKQA